VGPEFPLELGSMLFSWVYSPRKAEDFLAQHVIGGYGTKWDSGFPLVSVFVTPSFLNFVGSSSICVFPLVLVFVTPSFLNFLEFLSPLPSAPSAASSPPMPPPQANPPHQHDLNLQNPRHRIERQHTDQDARVNIECNREQRHSAEGLTTPRYSSEPFLLNH
jgi:hypothetical protein